MFSLCQTTPCPKPQTHARHLVPHKDFYILLFGIYTLLSLWYVDCWVPNFRPKHFPACIWLSEWLWLKEIISFILALFLEAKKTNRLLADHYLTIRCKLNQELIRQGIWKVGAALFLSGFVGTRRGPMWQLCYTFGVELVAARRKCWHMTGAHSQEPCTLETSTEQSTGQQLEGWLGYLTIPHQTMP